MAFASLKITGVRPYLEQLIQLMAHGRTIVKKGASPSSDISLVVKSGSRWPDVVVTTKGIKMTWDGHVELTNIPVFGDSRIQSLEIFASGGGMLSLEWCPDVALEFE